MTKQAGDAMKRTTLPGTGVASTRRRGAVRPGNRTQGVGRRRENFQRPSLPNFARALFDELPALVVLHNRSVAAWGTSVKAVGIGTYPTRFATRRAGQAFGAGPTA